MRRLRLLFDRIIFLYFFIGIVPLMVIASLFLKLSTEQFSDKIKETYSLQAQNYTATANTEVDHLLQQVYAIAIDTDLISIIRQFDNGSNQPYTSTLFHSEAASFRTLNLDISDFIYINADAEYMLSQKYPNISTAAVWKDEELRKSMVDSIIESNSICFFTAQAESSLSYSGNLFYLGFPIKTGTKKLPTGALIIAINERFFENMPDNLETQDLNQSMYNLIVDQSNQIVFCDDTSFIGSPLSTYLSANHITDKSYTLSEQEINLSPWRHLSYLPNILEFHSLAAFQRNLYVMLTVLCSLIFLLVASIVVGQNLRIRSIAQGIVHFSGAEQDYRLQSHTNSILQEIVDEFNAMTKRVQELIQQLKEKEQIIVDSLNRQRVAEIKTLEAQINPHFLSNTLNTISWAAIEKEEFEISDMICSISHLLQYSIRNVDKPVYLADEIQWLNNYMFLQEKRFGNLFQYTITINDTLIDDCKIYKLLLQPVLENSILHAFDQPTSENHIFITIEPLLLTDQLQITIADNGLGIPEDTLSHILNNLHNEQDASTAHIGISSAYNRLRAYYGDSASMIITSSSSGTKTVFTLPILHDDSVEEDLI